MLLPVQLLHLQLKSLPDQRRGITIIIIYILWINRVLFRNCSNRPSTPTGLKISFNVNCCSLFFRSSSISLLLSSVYPLHWISTVSLPPHQSHSPVGCFPSMCEVELNPLCPNLSLERTQSSFLLPLEFLPLPTVGCTECRYLPFKPLSQNNCQFVFIPFLIIDLSSALLYRICISIFSFIISCLANWSASSFPANPVWAGTHNHPIYLLQHIWELKDNQNKILSSFRILSFHA